MNLKALLSEAEKCITNFNMILSETEQFIIIMSSENNTIINVIAKFTYGYACF